VRGDGESRTVWHLFRATFCTSCGAHHDVALPGREPADLLSQFEFDCPSTGRAASADGVSVGAVLMATAPPDGYVLAQRVWPPPRRDQRTQHSQSARRGGTSRAAHARSDDRWTGGDRATSRGDHADDWSPV
jgi:hypothetical protein